MTIPSDLDIARAAFEQVDGQPHCVTQHGPGPEHPHLGFVQEFTNHVQVCREWRLHEGS